MTAGGWDPESISAQPRPLRPSLQRSRHHKLLFFPAGEFRSIHPVPLLLQERRDPRLGLAVILRPFPHNLLPHGPERRVIGMEVECPPHRPEEQAACIRHPHHHAAVELALCRAVAVDRAAEEVSLRAEETAG